MSEEIKRTLLGSLVVDIHAIRIALKQMGIAEFDHEQTESAMVENELIGLIGDLQFYRAVQPNLHVVRGTRVHHLGPEDDK